MNVSKTSIAIALMMLVVPVASSSWSAGGNIEPNTPYDDSTWMHEDPPSPIERNNVYFNVISMIAPLGVVGVSPNSATLGTQIESGTNEYHLGILGVWVDCNGDGYVGLAESAMKEYPSDLLLDDSVCPGATGAGQAWPAGEHNFNGWVTELVPIGRTPPAGSTADRRVYLDPEAGVWGDYGKPDERATFRSCALAPQPRGTYQSTGGALNYVECRAEQNGFDLLGNFNDAMAAIGDPLGLAGSDPLEDDWRTTGLDVQTFGSEDSSNAPATVFDCGAEHTIHSGDTANQTPLGPSVPANLQNVYVTGINPQTNPNDPTTWTVPGLVNHTIESQPGIRGGTNSNCNFEDDPGHDFYGNWITFYVGEEDFNGVSPNNKIESDWNFNFSMEARGTVPFGPALGSGANGAPGTTALLGYTSVGETAWYSPSVYASKLGPRTLKVDLENSDVGFSRGWWMTFYAYVGKATSDIGAVLPGNSANYGAWQCGENEDGIHNGWNCNVDTWYKNQDGSNYPEPFHFARPGDPYNLRDVDCYDGRVGDLGVGAGLPFYGDEPCP